MRSISLPRISGAGFQPAKAGIAPSKILAAISLFLCVASPGFAAETFDLILHHGRLVDGTGNPAFFADVALKNGRIAAIGKVRAEAKEEIDLKRLIVAPGFIDVHTHAEDID